jgi:hypothetical protein
MHPKIFICLPIRTYLIAAPDCTVPQHAKAIMQGEEEKEHAAKKR